MSGGCVEGAAAEEIEQARQTGNARVIRYGISDEQAWDVGLACGGTIDVLVQPAILPQRSTPPPGAANPTGSAIATLLPADAPPPEHREHQGGEEPARRGPPRGRRRDPSRQPRRSRRRRGGGRGGDGRASTGHLENDRHGRQVFIEASPFGRGS